MRLMELLVLVGGSGVIVWKKAGMQLMELLALVGGSGVGLVIGRAEQTLHHVPQDCPLLDTQRRQTWLQEVPTGTG